MKRYFNRILFVAGCGLLLLASCKKDEEKVYFNGGTAPVLTATAADSIPLNPADSNNTAVGFSWTNPNYQFSNGISSMNVTYYLQIDTAGANFTSKNMVTVSISNDLSKSFTVTQLNNLLGNGLLLAFGQPHNIQTRIESFLASGDVPQYSNALAFTVTPYAPPPVVDPPASGELFIVGGDPKIGAWANPVPISQQFTQVSSTEFKLTITLSGGDPTNGNDQYLFLPVNGSWSHKYACSNTGLSGLNAGGSFGYDLAQNFPGPLAGGTYLIDVNFQTGKFSVTKQ